MRYHSNCTYVTIIGATNPNTGGKEIVIEGRTDAEAFRLARQYVVFNGMKIDSETESTIVVKA